MTALRVGTRGSDLALAQTRWVCDQLRTLDPTLSIEETIITTHGDVVTDRPFDAAWPAGDPRRLHVPLRADRDLTRVTRRRKHGQLATTKRTLLKTGQPNGEAILTARLYD